MPATQLFFNGRLTAKPGAYSKVDASGFDSAGLGASGIVALLGESVGGKPYTAVSIPRDDLQRATNTGQVKRLFRSGDLLEMSLPMFSPAKDPEIQAGAQQIVFVKVNPATQSQADFNNVDGAALRLKSADYGAFTTQIKATIANATTGVGKLVTINFEDTTETFDLLGNIAKFTLTYNGGADGATAMRVNTLSTAVTIEFDRSDLGQDTAVVQAPAASALELVSSSVGDVTQVVTVYGLNGSNVPTVAVVTLTGTTPVALPGTWNLETALVMSVVAVGTVTLRIGGAGATVVTLAPGQTNKGRVTLDIPAAGVLAVNADGATTRKIVYRGLTAAGASLAEVVTLNGLTPVPLAGAFARLTSVEVLNVETARTAVIKGLTINAPVATYPNLQKLKDLVSANPDFTFISIIGNAKDFLVADLDYVTAVDVFTPATASFFAKLFDIVSELNNKSSLVVASRLSPGTGAPSNTVGGVFLAGGLENSPASAGDWQAAIDKLKQVFVNTLVLATDDAAIHAAGVAHCAFMGGAGKMERDIVVGAAANETKAQLKARALALNSRHVRLESQEVSMFNAAGETAWQPPKFLAGLVAGMQAGTSVGNPLTNKYVNVLGFRQNATINGWNPVDDADEMLLAGLHFLQLEEGKGFKVVRNITTHLVDENLVFIEASMNQAVNFAVYNLRTRMETIVGKKGFARTINAAKSAADGVLEALVREEIIAAYKKPAFELALDVLRMDVAIAVIAPVNFIPITVNLYPLSITA